MKLFATPSPVRSLALASLVLLGACSKKDDDPTPTPTPSATTGVTWTVDNTNYTSTTASAIVQGNMMTLIGASTANGSASSINLIVPAATGTYSTTGTTTSSYSMSYNTGSTAYIASSGGIGSGTVTVTTFSTTEVVGTFSFTGANATGGTSTKAVTNGKFSIKR